MLIRNICNNNGRLFINTNIVYIVVERNSVNILVKEKDQLQTLEVELPKNSTDKVCSVLKPDEINTIKIPGIIDNNY